MSVLKDEEGSNAMNVSRCAHVTHAQKKIRCIHIALIRAALLGQTVDHLAKYSSPNSSQ